MQKVLTILFFTSASILIASQALANGAISDFEIKDVWVGGYTDDGKPTTRITLVSPHSNPDSCTFSDRIVIYSSQVGVENTQTIFYEQQYAAALLALANGNKMDAFLVGCTLDDKSALASRLTIKR